MKILLLDKFVSVKKYSSIHINGTYLSLISKIEPHNYSLHFKNESNFLIGWDQNLIIKLTDADGGLTGSIGKYDTDPRTYNKYRMFVRLCGAEDQRNCRRLESTNHCDFL